jgi:riboflavin transporter FmnP
MDERAIGLLIPLVIVATVAGAYILAWRRKSSISRRVGSWVLATACGLAGVVAVGVFALPIFLETLRAPEGARWKEIAVGIVIAGICTLLLAAAATLAGIALREKGPHKSLDESL